MQNLSRLFTNPFSTRRFEEKLTRLVSVTLPIAKAIKCLESSHSTPSDIFIFWVAVTASIKKVLDDGTITGEYEASECDQIRAIVNYRYKQLLESGPTDVYISTFYLDPRALNYSCLIMFCTDRIY